MLEVLSLSPCVSVKLSAAGLALPPQIEREVDKIWHHHKSNNNAFDGTIFSIREFDENVIVGCAIAYKLWIAQQIRPELFGDLGVQPLAVTGFLRCADGVVFGRRGKDVRQDAGLWELAPSGGVDVERVGDGETVDVIDQLLQELSEELGLCQGDVFGAFPFCMVSDSQSHVIDIAIELQSKLNAQDIHHAHRRVQSREYIDVAVVAEHDVAKFVGQLDYGVAGVSQAILERRGLLIRS